MSFSRTSGGGWTAASPPIPYAPVVREYHGLLKKHAPGEPISYTTFGRLIGAKVLVEATKRAGGQA